MNQANVICHIVKKKKKVTNIKQYKLGKTKYTVVTETFKQTLTLGQIQILIPSKWSNHLFDHSDQER